MAGMPFRMRARVETASHLTLPVSQQGVGAAVFSRCPHVGSPVSPGSNCTASAM